MRLFFSNPLILCFVWLCAIAGQSDAAYDPIALYLTWQRHPETTMTICWITQLDRSDDTIYYQQEGKNLWQQTTGNHAQLPEKTPYLIHVVELTDLDPAHTYYFCIGNEGMTYKFRTMPSSFSQPIRFVAGGDVYHDGIDLVHETNRQAAKTSPHFALIGGDIAYASGMKISSVPSWITKLTDGFTTQKFDRWLTWLMAWKQDMITPEGFLIPFLPVLGNHDVSGGFNQSQAQAPFFYSLFPMPGSQGYNVLDFGNYMSIILLDSDHTNPIEGSQTAWLDEVLEQRQQVPHKFAVYHVPAYPSYRPYDSTVSEKIRTYWVPLFDQYRLTAAYEHHDHDYKRTYPLLHGKIDANGVHYFGDGAWGVAKPRVATKLSKKWYLEKTAPARHFLLTSIEPSGKKTVSAIRSDGQLVDQVSW